jgi:hypothetical protein
MLEHPTSEAAPEVLASSDEAVGTNCCSPTEQTTCCEPGDKADCCRDRGASCACR